MFLDNEDGRQVEPGRIIEHPIQKTAEQPAFSENGPGREIANADRPVWGILKKHVELYFAPRPVRRITD